MATNGASIQQLLKKEAQAWRDLPAAEYDKVLCKMLADISSTPLSAEHINATLALVGKTLRRDGPTLTESRCSCAEHLLELVTVVSDPTQLMHIRLLFLLAWFQLGRVVELGPDSISVSPELPVGVALPDGADPDVIDDPVLREQARAAAVRHGAAVERWNAKQRALDHLNHLARFIQTRVTSKDDENVTKELMTAMSLAPGLPCALRKSLTQGTK